MSKIALALMGLTAALPAFLFKLAPRVVKAAEGGLTADEAESLVRDVHREYPDVIRVKVAGVDVVDDQAEGHLIRGISRVIANVVSAAT